MGVYIYESESIAIRNGRISDTGWNTGMLCRNTGTGTRTGTKLKTAILRSVLVIPEFERGTKFWESRELLIVYSTSGHF